jgi:hypothetical protein
MPTPRTRNQDKATRVRRKKQLTLPESVCVEMGIEVGDTFTVSRVKRAQKISKGAIVLTPSSTMEKAHPWSEEEWKQKIQEAKKDIAAGRMQGPFESAEEAIGFLHKQARQRRAKR